jgi:hypothetical protein
MLESAMQRSLLNKASRRSALLKKRDALQTLSLSLRTRNEREREGTGGRSAANPVTGFVRLLQLDIGRCYHITPKATKT